MIALNASDSPQEARVTYGGNENGKVVFGDASDISVSEGFLKFKVLARSGVMLK